MYAQVVFNLPIEGPFDYLIPAGVDNILEPGMRVKVSFGKRICLGYVVSKSRQTQAKKIKPIIKILDSSAVLDKAMLRLTREIAGYYASSWGQVIESALPVSLKRGRKISLESIRQEGQRIKNQEVVLLQDIRNRACWQACLQDIKDSLREQRGVIILTPDKESAELIQKELQEKLNSGVGLLHSYQSAKEELRQWVDIRCGKLRIVVGTRMAVFAPVNNLGLIIVEEEQSTVYKQDSSPHYHAPQVARLRSKGEGAKLILSSSSPTLETFRQAREGRIKYFLKDGQSFPREINLIDLNRAGFNPQRREILLSISMEDAINKTINEKGRVALFLNRRGFAVFASCQHCGLVLRCPRCNANLVLHFTSAKLVCHQCNYSMQSPKICPNCNSGYIRYSGLGTEKLESEISRLYPQVKIARLDKDEKEFSRDAEIIIATESIFKHRPDNLDLVGVISLDAVLRRPDFRAAERVFGSLIHLASLTSVRLMIQTNFPRHYCFQALLERKIELFYESELALRGEAKLPPFGHIIAVQLRGAKEEKVRLAGEELFQALSTNNRGSSIKVFSRTSPMQHKKRDKFYEQVLLKTDSVKRGVDFLRNRLANFRRSGIIITVDVDPV
ncbi:MAG: primosomal protein N' [Candidatus Omnitrophica bacterium]|nr:primosomal protein N' [Candidatus Omnitrophota bacterium]